MFHILASLFCLCYTTASYCSTLTNAIFESISAVIFLSVLFLNPLSLIPSLLIGTGIYYWFLKPIPLERAFAYTLISFISSAIGFFLVIILSKITYTFIIERSYVIGTLFIAMFVLIGIAIDMLIMHHVFKYPYKKIVLPIVTDVIIRFALIALIAWLTPPILGP